MENTDDTITEKIPLNGVNRNESFNQPNKVEIDGGIPIKTDSVENTSSTSGEKQSEKDTEWGEAEEKDLPNLESVGAGYPFSNTLENSSLDSSNHKKEDITADDAIAILKKKINSNPIDVD